MAPESSYGSFDHVNLKGRNVGAVMSIRLQGLKDPPQDSCCINIYVNNSIQGVNNSILLGSEVKMRDPGVSIFFDGMKFGKEWMESKKRTSKEDTLGSKLRFLGMFVLAFISFLLFLLLL